MDVQSLNTREAHNAGAEMQVLDAEGKATDVHIRVVGLDSDVWRKLQREDQVKRLIAARSGKKQQQDTGYDTDALDMLAKATISWRGLTAGGQDYPCTFENARKLYANAPYIADQVDRFIGQRANFTKG